eukprot:symbB.v1.2.031766.t1/scaffold3723.1/size51423/3
MIRKRPPVRRPGSKEHTLLGGAASTSTVSNGSGVRPEKKSPGGHPKKPRGGAFHPPPVKWQTAASCPEDDGGTGGAGPKDSLGLAFDLPV